MPDGFRHYYYDLRKDKPFFFPKRQFVGGSVMVWAFFAANGTPPLVSIRGRLNLKSCVNMLTKKLLSEAPLIISGDYLF